MRKSFPSKRSPVKRRSGFTLIEILVVIFIIGLLVAILVPGVNAARNSAWRSTSANNLRQLVLGLVQHNDNLGFLPHSARDPSLPAASQPPRIGWAVSILPYLDRKDLYDRYDFTKGWQTVENRPVASQVVDVFINPATPDQARLDDAPEASPWVGTVAATDYATFSHVAQALQTGGYVDQAGDGFLPKNKKSSLADVRDGLTNTIALIDSAGRPYQYIKGKRIGTPYEVGTTTSGSISNSTAPTVLSNEIHRVNGGGWARNANDISLEGFTVTRTTDTNNNVIFSFVRTGPSAINVTNGEDVVPLGVSPNTTYYGSNGTGAPYSFHPGGVNAAFADGRVAFISEKIDIKVLGKLVTRNGNEVIDESTY